MCLAAPSPLSMRSCCACCIASASFQPGHAVAERAITDDSWPAAVLHGARNGCQQDADACRATAEMALRWCEKPEAQARVTACVSSPACSLPRASMLSAKQALQHIHPLATKTRVHGSHGTTAVQDPKCVLLLRAVGWCGGARTMGTTSGPRKQRRHTVPARSAGPACAIDTQCQRTACLAPLAPRAMHNGSVRGMACSFAIRLGPL